jgi:hypothetical protein
VGNHRQVETREGRDHSAEPWLGRRSRWQAGTVLLVGLLITVGLTVSAALNYDHNERRLSTLQTRLTASVLQTAQPQLQAILARVVGVAAGTTDPVPAFQSAMATELQPHKHAPFASATLAVVRPEQGQVLVLAHVGTPAIRGLQSKATTQVLLGAARSHSLMTTRVVSGHIQKLGYLLAAPGHGEVYVVAAGQELPYGRPIKVPAGSPYANLNFALYFGPSISRQALVDTNVQSLPLTGTVSKETVPFGNHVLTLVASPQGSLSGTWSEYLPWGILVLGILLSIGAAVLAENLVRRRATAEASYRQQRRMSETLQRSLLPKQLPEIPRWEFAARYVPATQGADIGGDWYSVVEIDDHRFAMVVGDVSGHDIAAAGVMAALRYTIRTLVKLGIPPDEILDRASKELDVSSDRHFATVLVGIVDTRAQQLTLVSAGHPPPLMIHDGRAELLAVPPGVPLGVLGGPRPAPTTVQITPNSTLVAFTDGLIEKRDRDLDERLEQLAEVAAESPTGPDDLITRLLDELTSSDEEDDIVVLALRFCPQEANVQAGDPSHSGPLTADNPTTPEDLYSSDDSTSTVIRSGH